MRLTKFTHFLLFILALSYVGLVWASAAPVKPFPPFRIAGNLYYVGNSYAANYLVVTSQGNILINSNDKVSVPMLKDSIEKLGLKWSDTKILLISQGHSDHGGGSVLVKEQTGARYMVMDGDVSVVESGGKTDFLFGDDLAQRYEPTKVDHVLHDGDRVKLGNTVLVAHLTPGHTKGCTTWTMDVTEQGKKYHVVIVGGVSMNPGTKLIHNAAYPNIVQDYEHMWHVLKKLPCDIFLGAHGMYFGLDEKYARMKKDASNPFVDPDGYQQFLVAKEHEFRVELDKQTKQ